MKLCSAVGSDQPTMTLNFSRGASMIIAQYYQFLRLGFDGYKKIMSNLLMVARRLRLGIEETGLLLQMPCLTAVDHGCLISKSHLG